MLSITLPAQQLYNGGFELWSSPANPDGWGTWASAVGQYNSILGDSLQRLALRDTINFAANNAQDSTSVKLVVDTCSFPSQGLLTLPGFIAYGGAFYAAYPDTPAGLRFGYYPYSKKPDSLIFDYKYVPATANNDSALVIMTMNRYDSALSIEVIYVSQSWLLTPTNTWTHLVLPINYLVTDTLKPDSIQLIFLSSVASAPHRGTALWLDTIHFDAGVDIIDTVNTGIANIGNSAKVKAYPNPSGNSLNVILPQQETGSIIELIDGTGQVLYNAAANTCNNTIDTKTFCEGIYTLRIYSADSLTTYTGRVSILHGP